MQALEEGLLLWLSRKGPSALHAAASAYTSAHRTRHVWQTAVCLLQHSILLACCLRGLLTLAAMSFAGCFSVTAVFAQIWQQECKRQGSEGQQTGPKAHA
jgi:hypothetical protein